MKLELDVNPKQVTATVERKVEASVSRLIREHAKRTMTQMLQELP